MLKNAYLYEDEIRRNLHEVWYDPKYQYYFSGAYHNEFMLTRGDSADWSYRAFASVNTDGKVAGLIDYCIDHEVGMANRLGAINFTDDRFPFARDLRTAVDDIFVKFGLNKLEMEVMIGNPVERTYDRLVPRYGGRIVGIKKETLRDMSGKLCDIKMYEIMRDDYLRTKKIERRRNVALTKTRMFFGSADNIHLPARTVNCRDAPGKTR